MQTAAGPFSGHIAVSADGLGVELSSSGQIQTAIALPNSTILVALLYSKTNNAGTMSQIGFAGATVPMTEVPSDPIGLLTYRGDVTSLVAAAVGTGSGTFNFTVDESVTGLSTQAVDGEALYVVYQNTSLPTREVYIMEGGVTSPAGEAVDVPLLTPYAGGRARMSIGDSFSTGDCPVEQYTIITVQGQQLTPCAGGLDDGDAFANGALITVGGIGDDFANPGRADDELYHIQQLLTLGDTSIHFVLTNPDNGDSVFTLALAIQAPGAGDNAAAKGLFN